MQIDGISQSRACADQGHSINYRSNIDWVVETLHVTKTVCSTLRWNGASAVVQYAV